MADLALSFLRQYVYNHEFLLRLHQLGGYRLLSHIVHLIKKKETCLLINKGVVFLLFIDLLTSCCTAAHYGLLFSKHKISVVYLFHNVISVSIDTLPAKATVNPFTTTHDYNHDNRSYYVLLADQSLLLTK